MKRLNLNTDTTLNSNSNTLASSQKAIKAYADTKLSEADKAVANGVASLDANGKVPPEQIPVATSSSLGGVKLEFDETTGTLNIKTE